MTFYSRITIMVNHVSKLVAGLVGAGQCFVFISQIHHWNQWSRYYDSRSVRLLFGIVLIIPLLLLELIMFPVQRRRYRYKQLLFKILSVPINGETDVGRHQLPIFGDVCGTFILPIRLTSARWWTRQFANRLVRSFLPCTRCSRY